MAVEKPIYLDNMATTEVDPRVLEKMLVAMTSCYGNPSSNSHPYGWDSKEMVDQATCQAADAIGARVEEIIWTSGATEANNLAIYGVAGAYKRRGQHIITCATEHKAVLEPCQQLEKQGFQITYLQPDRGGMISLEQLQQAITSETILVSLMWVNNETGVMQDIPSIAKLTRQKGVLLHVDAAQAIGKIPVDISQIPIDLLSLSAHKIYGPKGVGALFVCRRPRVRLHAQIHGGGQQYGLRGGTLPTQQIVAMAEALTIAQTDLTDECQRIEKLRHHLWQGIAQLPEVYLNGHATERVPHNLNICFRFVDGEALMMALPELAFSSGSACNAMLTETSHVLRAMGYDDLWAASSVRISLGRFTTMAEVDSAIELIVAQVTRLRGISPLWERFCDQEAPAYAI